MTNKIKGLLDMRYGLRPQRLHATVTAAPLVAGRSAGYVTATVGGVGGVRVNVDPDRRTPLTVGDTLVVQGTGTAAAMEYWADGRIAGARAESDVYQFPTGGTAGGTTMGAGDILLGSTLADWSNWWYQFELGRWQIRKGTLLTGAIGDLNNLYGYATSTYGSAFGQYSANQVNITTDPTNGFRIRNYTTPVFQADTSGVVWALSTFRAGTGNDMVGMSATDATWRLYAGSATPASAPFRVDKDGALTATGATISGAISGSTIDIGGADVTSFHVDVDGNLWSGAAAYANGVFKVSNAGALVATSATITGTINATAGYFGDGATRVTIEAAGLNVGNTGSIRGGRTAWDTGTGFWLGYYSSYYRFAIGVPSGREMVFDGVNLTLNGALVTQLYQGSEPSIFGWQCTCVFSATDADTVAWTSGTFTLSDGTAYSISAGNTGNMAARNYIYLDKAVSTTVLQKTTTASTAVGSGKVLIATAINSTTEALWQVFSGTGGVQIGGGSIEQRSITASEIATGTLTANEIAANTITAGQIAAGTITTTQIAANTIVAGNIAGSTITGAKIAAGTITAGLLSVTAGGANLIRNSTFQLDANSDNLADWWITYNDESGSNPITPTIVTTGGVDGRYFQRIAWANTNAGVKGIRMGISLAGYGVEGGWKANTTYIVSWWGKTSGLDGPATIYFGYVTGPASVTYIAQPALSAAWQYYAARVVYGATGEADGLIQLYTPNAVIGNIEIDHVQVEQADTPSSWKPFPSELEPGSVTADKIYVTSLSAIKADLGSITAGTITGGTIRTAASGARIELSTTKLFGTNGTTEQFYASATDGKLYAGAGNVLLDSGGMSIVSSTVYTEAGAVKWKSGSQITAYVNGLNASSTQSSLLLSDQAEDGGNSIVYGLFTDSSTPFQYAALYWAGASANTFRGLKIGEAVSPSALLDVGWSSSGTNDIVPVTYLRRNTTGTAAAGFGTSLVTTLESSTTIEQNASSVQTSWYEATHASRKADLTLLVYDAAGTREGLRIRANGSAPAIGFYGVTPVARAAHIADATDAADVITRANAIIAALEGIGILAAS